METSQSATFKYLVLLSHVVGRVKFEVACFKLLSIMSDAENIQEVQ